MTERTLGLDLAADPTKTAACVVAWESGEITALSRPLSDDDIVAASADVDLVAIDVPLGWPDDLVDALGAHRAEHGWPPATRSALPPQDRIPLRFRETDRFIQATGHRPLSVSTDRIGVAAMRGARLQHLFREAGVEVDRTGTSGRIAEAYPAAALRVWGLPNTGYKGPAKVPALRALTQAFAARCVELADRVQSALDGCDDDDFDALICAFIGRAVRHGLTTAPPSHQLPAARREGWIHIPTATVAEIVRSAGPA